MRYPQSVKWRQPQDGGGPDRISQEASGLYLRFTSANRPWRCRKADDAFECGCKSLTYTWRFEDSKDTETVVSCRTRNACVA